MSALPNFGAVVGLFYLLMHGPAQAGLVSTGAIFLNPEAGSSMSANFSTPGGASFTHGYDGVFRLVNSFERKGAQVRFNDGRTWAFDFDAPTYTASNNTDVGQPLEVKFYDRVQALYGSSPTRPGFNILGPSSYYHSNTQSGWFNVLDVSYSASGQIERLAVDFKQFDGPDSTGKSTYGSLRLNSSVPLNLNNTVPAAVPLPATAWLMACGLGALALRARARHSAA